MFPMHFKYVKSEKKNWIMLNGSRVRPKFVKNRLGYRKGRRNVGEQVKSQ
jgi:hypothetical protein